MSNRNVASRVRSSLVSRGYSSADNSSQSTEPQIVHPKNLLFGYVKESG